jgi:hypothetical protein
LGALYGAGPLLTPWDDIAPLPPAGPAGRFSPGAFGKLKGVLVPSGV